MIFDFLRPRTAPRQDEDATDRLAALERKVRALEVEWNEWFDKYRRLYARIAKRAERAEDDEKEPETETAQRHRPTAAVRNLRGF